METGTRKITFDEYRGINAVNASRLADFARSPAHCWLRMQKPMVSTKQTKLGIALHTALLEPDDFDAAFQPARFDGRTKDGKAEREAALLGGVTLLPEDDYMAVLGMRDSLATHPRVRALMAAATALEDSAVWMRGDRACKARRDVVGPDFLAGCEDDFQLRALKARRRTAPACARRSASYQRRRRRPLPLPAGRASR